MILIFYLLYCPFTTYYDNLSSRLSISGYSRIKANYEAICFHIAKPFC
nr:MAG TPA: hypothetical protein [Caudoviricetes sp.]